MKLSIKLPLAFAVSLLLMCLGAMYGLLSLSHSITAYNTVVRESVMNERAAASLLESFEAEGQAWQALLLSGAKSPKLQQDWARFVEQEHAVNAQARALLVRLTDEQSRSLLLRFVQRHASMSVDYQKNFEVFKDAGLDATGSNAVVAAIGQEPTQILGDAVKRIQATSVAMSIRTAIDAMKSLMVSIVLMFVTFGAGLGGAIVFSRSITRPLQRAVDVARTVALGNLINDIDARGSDEISGLLRALKDMQGSLGDVVSSVRRNAHAVATASSQIATGNLNFSSRTEEQAAALQETAASMEQLTTAVRQNADHALRASKLAAQANETALRGGEVIAQVVEMMMGISESSSKVVDIIGVIEGIAFQTNILALNAAVEAARAGDQGRSFAVVASEVRALAQRSASAAREIKVLVGRSSCRVEAGAQLVQGAGEVMGEIVRAVRLVAVEIEEISSMSHEQSTGIDQVNVAVGQMDEVTQQNAALVEQASAAAQSMAEQAGALHETVSAFEVSDRPGMWQIAY